MAVQHIPMKAKEFARKYCDGERDFNLVAMPYEDLRPYIKKINKKVDDDSPIQLVGANLLGINAGVIS